MKVRALAVVSLLVAMALTALVVGPMAGRGLLVNAQLTESSGPTPILGGGDHVMVRFGSDAAFGVVYGNATNPNNVYLAAIKARYLGVGQVYDQQGKQVASNRPIKIYTLYAVKLDDIVEFKDVNGNGIADYTRAYDNGTGSFTTYTPSSDNFYKRVDLKTSWARSPVVRVNATGYRSWTFNVSASNLPYVGIGSTATGTLPLVRFTFHLNASLDQVDNATVPQWKISVATNSAGKYYVTNASRLENLTVTGKVVHYDLKWDQLIQGWTFANGNNNGKRLLLEFHAIVGNLIPQVLADTWFEARLVGKTGESGAAHYTNSTGASVAINETTGSYPAPRTFKSPRLDFGGNWTRIARMVWVTNSTVDGATQPLYGQIMAGWRITRVGEAGNLFSGFVILGGMSFAGGATVVHDPDVAADVQADLDLPGAGIVGGAGLAGLLMLVGIVALVAIGALVFFMVILPRMRHRQKPPIH